MASNTLKKSTFSREDIERGAPDRGAVRLDSRSWEKRQLNASDIRGSGLCQLPRRHRGEPESLDARIVADR
jgi:hypothetical protein